MRKNVRFCSREGTMKNNSSVTKRISSLRRIATKKTDLQKRHYTIPELVKFSGISRKQVNYWAKINLLMPAMREVNVMIGRAGSYYSAEEVVKAMIIADLKRAGFSLRQIQQVARNLQEHGIKLNQSENYLLTDGYSVYYASNNSEVIDIFRHHRQMLLLVPVHEQVKRLTMAA